MKPQDDRIDDVAVTRSQGEPQSEDGGLRERLRRYEVKLILEALKATDGNQTKAAARLKLPLRTLAHKMKSLGIRRRGYAMD
jgi:DNA-binding NtrC family response regulator